MTKAFSKTIENYKVLHELNTGPYKESKSWTNSKTFIPDPLLKKQSFVQDPVIEKTEFVLNPEWCR
jgi:hypothetical protein